MNIFDCHVHVEQGLESYDLSISYRNVIFNYLESYKKHADNFRDENTAITLIMDFHTVPSTLIREIEKRRVQAIKIHSRIQEISNNDYSNVLTQLRTIPSEIPIIFDAFYFGPELIFQPSLIHLVEMAQKFSDRKIIVAHCGGHKMLEYFFHLRPLSNIYYDLSLSLQYLKDSSVFEDMIKLIKYTDEDKIMFGSDFPYGSSLLQYDILQEILNSIGLPEDQKSKINYLNAMKVFGFK